MKAETMPDILKYPALLLSFGGMKLPVADFRTFFMNHLVTPKGFD